MLQLYRSRASPRSSPARKLRRVAVCCTTCGVAVAADVMVGGGSSGMGFVVLKFSSESAETDSVLVDGLKLYPSFETVTATVPA